MTWGRITGSLLGSWHMDIDFEMVSPFGNFLQLVKLSLNRDIARFENYDIYAVPRLKCLVAGCQVVFGCHLMGSILYVDFLEKI